jgi:hypothetical protein
MEDNFKWTDEFVKEFANNLFVDVIADDKIISEFKKSKQQSVSNDWEIVSFGSYVNLTNVPPNAQIKSVRRLGDNEIFTVGDSVEILVGSFSKEGWRYYTGSITKFSVLDNSMFIECGNCSGSLEDAKKVKKPLFKTEDNKQIYEGDNVWTVRTNDDWGIHEWVNVTEDSCKQDWKYFAKAAAAKEYIIHKNPCLCYDEIVDWVEPIFLQGARWDRLKQLIEQKLNP